MSAVLPQAGAASTARTDAPAQDGSDEQDAPSAAQRLADSRERLRQRMLRGDGRHEARRRNAAAEADGQEPSVVDKLRAMPVIGVIVDAAQAWWSHHPLNSISQIAEGSMRDTVGPLARRHPIAIVAAAFVAGGLLAWLRPWRLLKPALFAGLASQLASRVIAQVPFESMLASFASFAHSRVPRDDDAPADRPENEAPSATHTAGSSAPAREAVPS